MTADMAYHPAPEPAPIFVVGFARSGTTLMQLMLSTHPRIYVCFETNFYSLPLRRRSVPDIVRGLLATGNGLFLGLDPDSVIRALPEHLPPRKHWQIFREIMRQKAAMYGRPRFGDKSPPHTRQIGRIYRDFPNARVILMVRDPRPAVLSNARMPWGSEGILANAIGYTGTFNGTRKYQDRILRVRLEDIQADARKEMQRVLDFVGEEWDERVLDHATNHPDVVKAPPLPWLDSSATPVSSSQGISWRQTEPAKIRAIEWLTRRSMEAYGYEPAKFEKEPSKSEVAKVILRDIPEAYRYFSTVIRVGWHLRKLESWAWDDEGTRAFFKNVNPSCWQYYPGFEFPDARDIQLAVTARVPESA